LFLEKIVEYEGIVIRPPSEANSLIIQATFGCSNNKCTFCPTYKGRKFRIKDFDKFCADVDEMSHLAYRRVFLADGDALIMPQRMLLPRLQYIAEKMPKIERVGVYGNCKAVEKKTDEQLVELRENGLGIVYFGLESGDPETLEFICKGRTIERMIEAGRRVRRAGLKLSVTVLLGAAGQGRGAIHAEATGKALTAMDPDFVGALTIMVVPNTPLADLQEKGAFEVPGQFDLLAELYLMLKHTTMTSGMFMSNHASNYLPLKVRMPDQKAAALAKLRSVIDSKDTSALKPEYLRAL
jgi:radical SAM superfamily enzyme YgiQ (UPF0313 family)